MKKLNRFHKNILINAVKISGSYRPEDNMYSFEEVITGYECEMFRLFLEFISDNGLGFGHGNIDSRFEEFKATSEYVAHESIGIKIKGNTVRRNI